MVCSIIDSFISNHSSAELHEIPLPRSKAADGLGDEVSAQLDELIDILADDRCGLEHDDSADG